MRFSYREFRKVRWAITLVGALFMILGMPIWMPIALYLGRPQLPADVEQAYMEKQRASEMATNAPASTPPSPGER